MARTSRTLQPKSEPSYNFVQLPTPPLNTPAAKATPAAESLFEDLASLESLVASYRQSRQKMHDDVLQDEDLDAKARTRIDDIAKDIADHEVKIETLRMEKQTLEEAIEVSSRKHEAAEERYQACSKDVKVLAETLRRSQSLGVMTAEPEVKKSEDRGA